MLKKNFVYQRFPESLNVAALRARFNLKRLVKESDKLKKNKKGDEEDPQVLDGNPNPFFFLGPPETTEKREKKKIKLETPKPEKKINFKVIKKLKEKPLSELIKEEMTRAPKLIQDEITVRNFFKKKHTISTNIYSEIRSKSQDVLPIIKREKLPIKESQKTSKHFGNNKVIFGSLKHSESVPDVNPPKKEPSLYMTLKYPFFKFTSHAMINISAYHPKGNDDNNGFDFERVKQCLFDK